MTISLSLASFDEDTQKEIVERASKHLAAALVEKQAAEKVYTVKTLAEYLDCHEDTVRGLLEQQKIPYKLLGKKGYRILGSAVQKYLTTK